MTQLERVSLTNCLRACTLVSSIFHSSLTQDIQLSTMVLHNPNNWHWVSKDVSVSAKAFLEKNLVGLSAEEGDVTAKIDSVLSMDGDCDVSQRKGKVITIFDVVLKLEWSGQYILDQTSPPPPLTCCQAPQRM